MSAVFQEIDHIVDGIPGPPGAGITPSQLANLLALTGGTMSGALILDMDSTGALIVRKADDTKVLAVDTTNKEVELRNGTKLLAYSDDGSTQKYSMDGATGNVVTVGTVTLVRVIGDTSIWSYVIDGGGSTISTGVKPDFAIPYNGKITGWSALGDQSGSIVVDLWKDSYANYPPTVADTFTTSNKPTISSATKGQNLSVNSGNGWTVTQGDIVRPNVDSVTTLTRAEILLFVTRT